MEKPSIIKNFFNVFGKKKTSSTNRNKETKKKSIVFNFSTSDYSEIFSLCLESQLAYCERHGIHFQAFTLPPNEAIGREVAWLKVPLLLGALESGYDEVAFVDSDVKISEDAPNFSVVFENEENSCIAMSNGHSGRLNSGVIFVKNTDQAYSTLKKILKGIGGYLPPCDKVGWGENGYFINILKDNPALKQLDSTWNNTFDKKKASYFTHYTGALREIYPFTESQADRYKKTKMLKLHLAKGEDSIEDQERLILELRNCYNIAMKQTKPDIRFSEFKSDWLYEPTHLKKCNSKPRLRIHICADVLKSGDSKNPYIEQLASSLSYLGADVITGGNDFWNLDYSDIDVLHIQWLEIIFNWKKPTPQQIKEARNRLVKIATTTKIFYTAHNMHLKHDYGEMSHKVMDLFSGLNPTVVHLSSDARDAYIAEHKDIDWIKAGNHVVIPHGDYSIYHSAEVSDAFNELNNFIFIPGGIRSKEEWDLVCAAINSAKQIGVHIVIAGQVSPNAVHWKILKELTSNPDRNVTRIHRSLTEDEFVSLLSKARAILIPRHERINSGVLFAAYSFLKPCLAPDQYSTGQYQRAVGGNTYIPGNLEDWTRMVNETSLQPVEKIVNMQSRLLKLLISEMSWTNVGQKHIISYSGSA